MTPNVDINLLTVQNLPPNKRLPRWIAFIHALASPLDWAMGIFNQYKNGGVTAFYNAAIAYNAGERVVYNYRVYESLTGSNTGNTPETSPDYWLQVNASFIGMSERSLYQGKKLILEYALNHYFREELILHGFTGFRQPDSAFTPTPSDIYVETVTPDYVSIFGIQSVQNENMITTVPRGYFAFSTLITGTTTVYIFNVYIPALVFGSIDPDPVTAERIVRNFVDKYRIAGVNYNVTTY